MVNEMVLRNKSSCGNNKRSAVPVCSGESHVHTWYGGGPNVERGTDGWKSSVATERYNGRWTQRTAGLL